MDEYSKHALEAILRTRPEWADLVTTRLAAGKEYFVIEIASPVPSQPDLAIESYREELTVRWGDWHGHVPDPSGWDEPLTETELLFGTLDDIFSEDSIIVCDYTRAATGERKCQAAVFGPRGSHEDPETNVERVVLSWKGTYSDPPPTK